MSLSIEMFLAKSDFQNSDDQAMLDAMKSARDDFISTVLGRDGYSLDEDVSLKDVLINGAKEPEKLVKRAEEWNKEMDERLEAEFQKVLRIYQSNPEAGFVKALSAACNLPCESENHTSIYSINTLMEPYDDEVCYGSDYGVITNEGWCSTLHARLCEEELQKIREHPERYFTAIISVVGE